MGPQSRRVALQSIAAVGSLTVTGCLGSLGPSPADAERQVETRTQPAPGTWPNQLYDSQNTRDNPTASPPRSDPTTAWTVPLSGRVSGLIVGPELIYANADGTVVAISRDGTEQWRREPGSGLSYVENRLYVVSEGNVVALDASTGQERWRSNSGDDGVRGLHEANGTVYVAHGERFAGYHADTGERLWRREVGRDPSLVADGQRIALVTAEQIRLFDPGASADGLLSSAGPRETAAIRHGWRPDVLAAALGGGALFVPHYGDRYTDGSASVRKFDLAAADEDWMTPLEWRGLGLVAVDSDRVYAAPYRATTDPLDGSLIALDRQTGQKQWRYDGSLLGSPSVGGDTVVAGGADPKSETGSGVLHAFDAASGERLWTIRPDHSYGGYPVSLAGDRVYVADVTGIHAVV